LQLVEQLIARWAAATDPAIFIATVSDADLRAAAATLMAAHLVPGSLPLWGITPLAAYLTETEGMDLFSNCSIPDDHIDPRRWALFAARWVLGDSRKEKRHARTTA
jgi:hypothetical protein